MPMRMNLSSLLIAVLYNGDFIEHSSERNNTELLKKLEKSLSGGLSGIDVSVESWGVYLAAFWVRKTSTSFWLKNSFRYTHNLYDIDYIAIPTKLIHNHASS